jgi:hypothetical protein
MILVDFIRSADCCPCRPQKAYTQGFQHRTRDALAINTQRTWPRFKTCQRQTQCCLRHLKLTIPRIITSKRMRRHGSSNSHGPKISRSFRIRRGGELLDDVLFPLSYKLIKKEQQKDIELLQKARDSFLDYQITTFHGSGKEG